MTDIIFLDFLCEEYAKNNSSTILALLSSGPYPSNPANNIQDAFPLVASDKA